MQLPHSFSSDHSLRCKKAQTFKTTVHSHFSSSSAIAGQERFCLFFFPTKSATSKQQPWEPLLFGAPAPKHILRRRNRGVPLSSCLSSLDSSASFATVSSARSRAAAVSPDNWKSENPPLVWCPPPPAGSAASAIVQSAPTAVWAEMCFPLPKVHMCLHCGGRQTFWLSAVVYGVLAAATRRNPSGGLCARLSYLYREIGGGAQKERRRLMVLVVIRLPSQRPSLYGRYCRNDLLWSLTWVETFRASVSARRDVVLCAFGHIPP